jgi:rhamnose transport system ATP-binding protein
VHGVSLEVRAGEVVGLAGLVGAGRTELARVLFGLTPAGAGEILLNGERVTIRSPREAVARGIAYVPEDRRRHGVILEMPVAHNLTMAVHDRLFPGAWLRFGAERQLAEGYIHDLAVKCAGPEAPAGSLSGGNQQKVALARWLATKPRLLILDEPTQGVDVGAKSEIHKLIRRLAQEGLAVLMISSDLPEVLGMGDRIGVMRGGTGCQKLAGGRVRETPGTPRQDVLHPEGVPEVARAWLTPDQLPWSRHHNPKGCQKLAGGRVRETPGTPRQDVLHPEGVPLPYN